MMTGEKPRTRRVPGSTLGSVRQGNLETRDEGAFSQPQGVAPPPRHAEWACLARAPPTLPQQAPCDRKGMELAII